MAGRYIISIDNVREVRAGRAAAKSVTVHDTDNLDERCNTDQIKHKSKFNNLDWALQMGYRTCDWCMSNEDEQLVPFGSDSHDSVPSWHPETSYPQDDKSDF